MKIKQFLGLLGFLSIGGVAFAADSPVTVSWTPSAPGEIRLDVEFPPPEWAEAPADAGALRYPVWKGLRLVERPGSPILPERLVRIAVPPGGEVRLEADVRPRGSAGGVRFPTVPVPEPESSERGPVTRPEREALALALAEAGSAARPAARIVAEGIERGVRIVTVAVSPVSYDPARGRAEWAAEVTVRLAVDGAPPMPAETPLRADDPDRGAWARTLANPEDALRWRSAPADGPAPEAVDLPDRWFDDTPGWVKLEIEENGVYALSRRELIAIGVPAGTLDPRTLRLYSGPLVPETGWDTTLVGSRPVPQTYWRNVWAKRGLGEGFGEGDTEWNAADDRAGFEEVALWVPGEADGSFDDADRLVFYALGPDNFPDRFGRPGDEFILNPYTDRTVYWLTWGGTLPGDPLRMAEIAAPAAGGDPVTAGPARLHAEGNTWYDPSMYRAGYRWEEWFWERMDSQRSAGITKIVATPGRVPESPFDARVRFWGANRPAGVGDLALHHVRTEIAGTLVGETRWSAVDYGPAELALAGEDRFPDAAALDFTFIVPELSPGRFDLVHLCWIDLTYRQSFTGIATLPRELRVDSSEGDRARFAAAGEPVVLDVTDFRRPVRLAAAAAGSNLHDVRVAAGGVRTLALAAPAAYRRPAGVFLDPPPARWLRETGTPADYVIVAYDEFLDEAQTLAAWRRQHLDGITDERPARVRVVRVSDVYDEFTWGMKDPAALRYFLEYAFRYWHEDVAERLSYALFLGDHTYDMRDNIGSGETSFVPSWEDNRDSFANLALGNVQYVTDDPLARFDGLYDPYTDLYLGRINAATDAEARDVIEGKVIRAEQNPDRGPWRSKAILVADDICQTRKPDGIGFGHMAQTERISLALPAAFDRDKIYLYEYGADCVYDAKPEAKQDLLASWNEGAWLVNYIGHGADIVLADEHVLDAVDIPLLGNAGRLPVIATFSCSVGKFSKPLSRGLGEGLVMSPSGGALACLAATHLTYSGQNAALNEVFVQKLFARGTDDPLPIGVALMDAKREEGGQSLKYVCLGDPASRISVPDARLVVEGLVGLTGGSVADVAITGAEGNPPAGRVEISAEGASELRPMGTLGAYRRTGATLFRGEAPLAPDTTRVRFVVPSVLRPGEDGRVRAYAASSSGDWDALGAAAPLPVVGTSSTSDDTTGPVIALDLASAAVIPGQSIVLSLSDPSGINITRQFDFQGVIVRVIGADGIEILRLDVTDRFSYELGSYTEGQAVFSVPELEAGAYELRLSAYDNVGNRGDASREIALGSASAEPKFRDVFAYPNPVSRDTRVHFALDRPAEVTARLFSVSGRHVRHWTLEGGPGGNAILWDGRDDEGDPVANGVYLLRLTAADPNGRGAAVHLERLVVYR